MPASSKPKWSTVKPKRTALTSAQLIEIIKDVFELSTDNRLFLAARLTPDVIGAEALEPYRKRIIVQFFPSRGFGKLNLKDARQAIRDYSKVTSDRAGTLELMMLYVEQGTAFTREYGDINEAFYSSLMSVLADISGMLKAPDAEPLYEEFATRLQDLKYDASDIGWGYGDGVREVVEALDAFWEE